MKLKIVEKDRAHQPKPSYVFSVVQKWSKLFPRTLCSLANFGVQFSKTTELCVPVLGHTRL